jgi:hypothetical protein
MVNLVIKKNALLGGRHSINYIVILCKDTHSKTWINVNANTKYLEHKEEDSHSKFLILIKIPMDSVWGTLRA